MRTTQLSWDETKREANIAKHGLDFADAMIVLDSELRMDSTVPRDGEIRVVSMAYVFDALAVLVVVFAERDAAARIISFRRASTDEREVYHEWLESDFA